MESPSLVASPHARGVLRERKNMKIRMKYFVLGLCVLAVAIVAITASNAQIATSSGPGQKAVVGVQMRESKERGPIRTPDMSPLGKEVASELIAGPNSGLDSAFIVYARVPAGAHGPAMYSRSVDEVFFVASGQLNVQIGTDKLVAPTHAGIFFPAGLPHTYSNDGADTTVVVEIVQTGASSADTLASLMKPAQPKKIDNTAQYIRPAKELPPSQLKGGNNSQFEANRADGSSYIGMHYDQILPKSGGAAMHIHPFNQVYYIVDGSVHLDYGMKSMEVKPNQFVVIPEGVVHQFLNDGDGVAKDILTLLPQPPPNSIADVPVDVHFGQTAPFIGATPKAK